MPMPFNAQRQIERLTAQYTRLEHLAGLNDACLTQVRSGISEWTPAQHLFHLLLANELSLKNAAALVAQKGLLIREQGQLQEGAAAVLERGRIGRGEAQSPRFVRPRGTVDLGFVRELVHSTRAQLKALNTATVASAPGYIPHQILGDLNAVQWLRFARMHTAHHILIVRDLLA